MEGKEPGERGPLRAYRWLCDYAAVYIPSLTGHGPRLHKARYTRSGLVRLLDIQWPPGFIDCLVAWKTLPFLFEFETREMQSEGCARAQ